MQKSDDKINSDQNKNNNKKYINTISTKLEPPDIADLDDQEVSTTSHSSIIAQYLNFRRYMNSEELATFNPPPTYLYKPVTS